MVGDTGGSRVEFRQEEVRYARRFDQVKVALACASIAALLCVAILCLERLQRFKTLNHELINATSAVLSEYSQHAESEVLFQKVQSEELRPVQATQQARHELTVLADELREQLGRSTSIPRLASGLDYLNAVVVAIDKGIDKIGRIQMTSIDLDIMKEKPTLKLNGIVNAPESVDALVRAIRACDAVVGVQEPPVSGTKDGRLQFTNLEIDLVVNYDPRAKSEAGK
jgi:hypothetical protein